MHQVGHVVAVTPPGEEVGSLRTDLRFAGVHVEVVDAEPGTYQLEDESFHEHVLGGRQGLLIGAVLGALLGVAIILFVPFVRELPGIAQLLIVLGVALQGTMPAMMWRMGAADHYDDDPDAVRAITAEDHLVIVDDEHLERRARHVLERHHAVLLTDEHPVEPAA